MKYLLLLLLCPLLTFAQVSPIDFEPSGNGAAWTWTPFENDTNPAVQIIANPDQSGINTSSTVVAMQTMVLGNPWAGFESQHGADIGTFTLDSNNAVVKVMVYKPVISDVGVKFATAAGASTGELKVANTKVNEWEELTFDFSSQIGHPAMIDIDQIIFFPDFNARTTANMCYLDNIHMGNYVAPPSVEVTFQVQNPPSIPVYVFGNWNNWANFPGAAMTAMGDSVYEVTLTMDGNRDIEFLYVTDPDSTKEVMDPSLGCTNGNAAYPNRLITLDSTAVVNCAIWETCDACTTTAVNDIPNDDIQLIVRGSELELHSNNINRFDAMEIYDMMGRRLFQSLDVVANSPIEFHFPASGMYLITIRKDQGLKTFKVGLR